MAKRVGFGTTVNTSGTGGTPLDLSILEASNEAIKTATEATDAKVSTEAKQDVGNSSLSSIDAKMTTIEASSVLAPINEDKIIAALNNINETLKQVLFILKGISE